MIEIIAVGRRLDSKVSSLVSDYESRLRAPSTVNWVFIPYSKLNGIEARRDESKRILKKVGGDHYVVLLDEIGENISSPVLSSTIERVNSLSGRKLLFIVGGAYGVDGSIKDRADFTWSLSNLVLPHKIVHLILIEQIYRAQEILRGGSYHHQ